MNGRRYNPPNWMLFIDALLFILIFFAAAAQNAVFERDAAKVQQSSAEEDASETKSELAAILANLRATAEENDRLREDGEAEEAAREDLTQVNKALDEQRISLNQENLRLVREAALIASEVVLASEKVKDLQMKLDSANAELKSALAEAATQKVRGDTFAATAARLLEERNSLEGFLKKSKDDLDSLTRQIAALGVKLEASQTGKEIQDSKNTLLRAKLALLNSENTQLKAELETTRKKQLTVRRELVGLKGGLKRVAILVDLSHSMSTSNRWDAAKNDITLWLQHLDMESCVLISFSNSAAVYPSSGELLDLTSEDGNNRAKLLAHMNSLKPGGLTNTLAAMKLACQPDKFDTIIIFTDGSPATTETEGKHDPEMVKKVLELARKNGVPVNAVGLGNYFKPDTSTFLLQLTQQTGGEFFGR